MLALRSIADEFEGPDARVDWRDSSLELPVRHGFIDLVAREFHAGTMMFPPERDSMSIAPARAVAHGILNVRPFNG